MASPQVLMAIMYAPMHMMLSAVSLYMFKAFLIQLSNASNQYVPPDYKVLKMIQPYLREINKIMEDEILGPADKIKLNITHVLLASILMCLLAMTFVRMKAN